MKAHQNARDPRHDKAEHVAQIVPGVGDQRDRIGKNAEHHARRDKGEVQPDADREGGAVMRRLAMACVVRAMRIVSAAVHVPVRHRHASKDEDDAEDAQGVPRIAPS